MSTKLQLPFSASIAADELHRSLDLSQPHGVVLKQFSDALQAAYDQGKADQPKNAFVFKDTSDEHVKITLNGKHVITANHEDDGWHGMSRIKTAIKLIAKLIGAEVVEK